MGKFCTNCGNKTTENQNICLNCGISINNNSEKKAYIGLILGLISVVAWIIPLFGYPITICGIVFSSKGINSIKKNKAITGLILSIIFLTFTFINSIIGIIINLTLYY